MAKKALLIGLNYPGHKDELRGCINDVQIMKRCLINRYGFVEEDITVLVDTDETRPKPTANNIRSALCSLIGWAKPGDVLFVHFSGHGNRMRNISVDTNDTGFTEFFVASDRQFITDVEFRGFVNMVPRGCHITFLADCCHSGGLIEGAKEQIGDSTKTGPPNSRSESDFEFGDFPNGDYGYVNVRSLPSPIQFDIFKEKIGKDVSSEVRFGLERSQHEGHPNSRSESAFELGAFPYRVYNSMKDVSLPLVSPVVRLKKKIVDLTGSKVKFGLERSQHEGHPNSRSESDLELGDFPNGDYNYVNDRSLLSPTQFDILKEKIGKDVSSEVKFGLERSQHEGHPNSRSEFVFELRDFPYRVYNSMKDVSLPLVSPVVRLKKKIVEGTGSKVMFGFDRSKHEWCDKFFNKGYEIREQSIEPGESSLLDCGILLSACQSYQKAMEAGNYEIRGVFSNAIQAIIEETNGRVTNRELVLKATDILERQGFRQKPGLYCSDHCADAPFLCADLKKTQKQRVEMYLFVLLIFFVLIFGGPLIWCHMA